MSKPDFQRADEEAKRSIAAADAAVELAGRSAAIPTDQLGGKTPWEFACMWYQPGQIAYSIARSNSGFGSFAIESAMGKSTKIPKDVLSQEFAEWLTEQYRLAMAKGIEIGLRSRPGS